jgi:hypothetical protein
LILSSSLIKNEKCLGELSWLLITDSKENVMADFFVSTVQVAACLPLVLTMLDRLSLLDVN